MKLCSRSHGALGCKRVFRTWKNASWVVRWGAFTILLRVDESRSCLLLIRPSWKNGRPPPGGPVNAVSRCRGFVTPYPPPPEPSARGTERNLVVLGRGELEDVGFPGPLQEMPFAFRESAGRCVKVRVTACFHPSPPGRRSPSESGRMFFSAPKIFACLRPCTYTACSSRACHESVPSSVVVVTYFGVNRFWRTVDHRNGEHHVVRPLPLARNGNGNCPAQYRNIADFSTNKPRAS